MNMLQMTIAAALETATVRSRRAKEASYLNGLSVLLEHVHSDHSLVKLWIQRLNNLIVQMFLTENNIEQCEPSEG